LLRQDQVGIPDHLTIVLEDRAVQQATAEMALGDCPQRVAAFDDVDLGLFGDRRILR